jgi:hypothetical protein
MSEPDQAQVVEAVRAFPLAKTIRV